MACELTMELVGYAVAAERGEEGRLAGELAELDRRDGAAAAGGSEPVAGVGDLAGLRERVDDGELDLLDMADDADPHRSGGRTSAAPLRRNQRRGSR